MKDKLEPNMYVRTKDGDMFILDKIEDNHLIPRYVHIPYIITEEDVLKTSHNIIDLIEDEDIAVIEYYVSKYRQRITRMFECSLFKSKEDEFVIFENKHCDWWYDKNKKEWTRAKGYNPKIKSIVTKEQLEAIQYVVK